ncbi:MAG: sigma-70 family RNA polymerase sigma factor [Planctomycetes bacterium]|nr:sigma-70 family RNA polymerase sigma factor [Planctomycetota bacterium]
MVRENGVSWRELVIKARCGPRDIDSLLSALAPVINGMAKRLAPWCMDDAIQAARVSVWKCLPWVQTDRPDAAIRQMLVTTAINAMRDEVRRQLRRERVQATEQDYMETIADSGASMSASEFIDALAELRLCNLLKMYAWHVRRCGTFTGAHRAIARRKGLSISATTEMFHTAAARWRRQAGLENVRKKYADIVVLVFGENYNKIYDKAVFSGN